MKMQAIAKSLLPIVCGAAFLEVSGVAQASPFLSLDGVKFTSTTHVVDGTNISSLTPTRKKLTSQIPEGYNGTLKVHFEFDFDGSNNQTGMAYINAMSEQSMITCGTHVQNHAQSYKNKIGYCEAKGSYLQNLSSDKNVRLRISSPGGGGNKYLDWSFVHVPAPVVENGIESINGPGTITKGDVLLTEIKLIHPAEGTQTIKWGLYPKSCFQLEGGRRPVGRDVANLMGVVRYQTNEIRRSFEVVSKSCDANTAVIKAWYADPGETANSNTNPDKVKTITLKNPRRR